MTLTHKFDVLLLTEIGDNANHFLSDDTIPGYRVFAIDVPTNNKYGGTAILIKNEAGTVTQRDDLKVKVTCQCSQCAVESIAGLNLILGQINIFYPLSIVTVKAQFNISMNS